MNTLADKLPKSLNSDSVKLQKANRLLPPVVSVLLILACSYTLAQITWALIPGDDSRPTPTEKPKRITASTNQPSFQHISDAHLFGEFQQSAPVKTTQTDAPETRLNLVLKGVLAATPMKLASAIISQGKGGKEDIYSVDDKIASAKVKEIHADRVILERGGRLETLRMPKDFSGKMIRSSPKRPSRGRSGTPGAVLGDIRQEILKNPTSFGKYAIPIPYNENGRLRGYRLQPQGDRSLFDVVGLQPSDVIIAVNGVELNNPAKGLKALRSLQRAKNVDLTVLRNGSEMPLHFDIP